MLDSVFLTFDWIWRVLSSKQISKPILVPLSNFGVEGHTFSIENSENKTDCLHDKNHKFKHFAGKSHSRSLLQPTKWGWFYIFYQRFYFDFTKFLHSLPMQKGKKNLILQDFSLVRRVFCYGNDKEICMHAIFSTKCSHFTLQKSNFQKTRKPENPKGPNPNPKADLSTKPEPEKYPNLVL